MSRYRHALNFFFFFFFRLVKTIPQPLAHSSQTLPPHTLVFVGHQLHDPSLQPDLLQLAPVFRHLLDQPPNIIASNRQDLLVVLPCLSHDLGQLLGYLALILV